MPSETTRPSLLLRVRDPEDGPAWYRFEQIYGPLIVRYARRRGLQQSDAEDVRQRVMMALASSLRSFSYQPEIGSFRDYIGRAVRNAVNRELSRPSRGARPLFDEDSETLFDGGPEPTDETWDKEWMQHHLRRALGSIRKTFDPASMLLFEELLAGAEVADVAAKQGTTPQAVHKVKQRIRDRLRQILATQVRDEDLLDGRS